MHTLGFTIPRHDFLIAVPLRTSHEEKLIALTRFYRDLSLPQAHAVRAALADLADLAGAAALQPAEIPALHPRQTRYLGLVA